MMLNEPYSKENFNSFLKDFLPDYQKDERQVRTPDKSILTEVTQLGTSRDVNVTVLEAECEETDTNRRIAITQAAFKVLRDHSIRNAIIAFHDGADQWRLSLLTSTLDIKNGKVVKKDSNPRRYSYLLGPRTKIVTPYKYLIEKGRVDDTKQLQERFSAEVVNNEFYQRVAKLYDDLVEYRGTERLLKYPGTDDMAHQFAVRLIGRIIFCWFLREKKSSAGVPLIDKGILSASAANQDNYYHSTLALLFFENLNKHLTTRSQKFQEGNFSRVPYLNGGLFSPQIGEGGDYYKFDRDLKMSISDLVNIPDSWLRRFFELLETYNFTVDENTSYDIDLSIDPEMLGRIFENLLARISPETGQTVRKSTGSFYTPREIVEYMVDESLMQYLHSKTKIELPKLRALVSYNLFDDNNHPLYESEKTLIVKALSTIKVFDPACGSGAFPIGVLQKIVFILQQVDPDTKLWLDNQLTGAPASLRRELEKQTYDYIRKSEVIRNSIYGVDIQPIATEITRLRCFLTLIVDENVDDNNPDNRGIKILPNLDFKFVTANTLISAPGNNNDMPSLFDAFEDELAESVNEYFSAEGIERHELYIKIRDLIDKKVNENKDYVLNSRGIIRDERFSEAYNKQNNAQSSKLLSVAKTWDSYKNIFTHQSIDFFDIKYIFPSAKDGFDIVIGNPPYVQLQKNSGKLANLYKDENYQTFARTGDIYSLFYERGLSLAKPISGILCYITSNKWMRAGYGEKTRRLFADKNPIKLLDFGGFKVFNSATVDTNILLIKNELNKNILEAVHFTSNFHKGEDIAEYFDSNKTELANLSSRTWFVGSSAEISLKEKIERAGRQLKDLDIQIYRGVLTGCNEAFIIDEQTKKRLIVEDSNNADIIKPLLRGRDIKRYKIDFQNQYILATGYDLDIPSRYPVIYRYIKSIDEQIQSGAIKIKGKGVYQRDDQGKNWWNLRHCNYYAEFEKEKIVWGNIAYGSSFSISSPGQYINAPANMLSSKSINLRYLLGVMNSKIFNYEFSNIGIDLGKAFEWKKQYVEQVHIPNVTTLNQHLAEQIESLVDKIENNPTSKILSNQIDQLVYELYGLTTEEIAIVEGS